MSAAGLRLYARFRLATLLLIILFLSFKGLSEARSDNIVNLSEASQATSRVVEPGRIVEIMAEYARRIVGCESTGEVLFEKWEKQVVRYDLTHEMVTSKAEMRGMLDLLPETILQEMSAKRCNLSLEGPRKDELGLIDGMNIESSGEKPPTAKSGKGVTGGVFHRGHPIVLNSEGETADLAGGEVLAFGRVACASVAIRIDGRVVGIPNVSGKQAEETSFEGCDLGFLLATGDGIGLALERATSYDKTRDQFGNARVTLRSVLDGCRAQALDSEEITHVAVRRG